MGGENDTFSAISQMACCKFHHEIGRVYKKYPGEQALLNDVFTRILVGFSPEEWLMTDFGESGIIDEM
jgi:hypothetical protein